MTKPDLAQCKRIVIKVGSLTLTDGEQGRIREAWLATLAQDIHDLRTKGIEVVIVSSGSVTLGRAVLGLTQASLELSEKQACAATGQIRMMQGWQQALSAHTLHVAQILLTAEDTENRRRYLNARTTMLALLGHGIIPIINENDTVTTAEIRYGDNDRLASAVAAMIGADALILLSDIDGFYTANPKLDASAKLLELIEDITPAIEAMAGGAIGVFASGGMKTKIMAAQQAVAAGCHMVISKGDIDHPILHILQGGICSWFRASQSPHRAYKQWIASAVNCRGVLTVDDGAKRALSKGNSLLPAGVVNITGQFERGDTVEIHDQQGHILGMGITIYGAADAVQIIGKHSDVIESILGYKRKDELIHRDDMVIKQGAHT